MVSGSRIEGGPQILSAGVRKTIQSIKEIVGNHSDADIYVALKETNMDPNETTQKLLNQDPFHEVKRKRDKKKEVTGYKGSTGLEPRKATGNVGGQGMRVGKIDSDQNVRRGGYARNTIPGTGVSREFRVVRDNRANQNSIRELKTPSASKTEPVILNVSENRGRSSNSNQKQPLVRASMSSNGAAYRQARNNYSSSGSKDILEEERQPPSVPNAGETNNDSSTSLNSSGGIVVGVYSSSSDPVHVPSLDSRPAANKREVGVVGVRRHFPKNNLSSHNASSSHPHLGPAREPLAAASENDQPPQTTTSSATVSVAAAAMPNMPPGRPFVNNHHHHHQQHSSSNRSQQVVAHHKGSQPNKEWKPKSSQKPNVNGPGVIGAPAKSVSDNPKEKAVAELQEKVSRVKISENQNVIIAAHIRVSETDRSRLTFGTLGAEFNPLQRGSELQEVGGAPESIEPSASISISAPESSSEETSVGSKQGDSIDEHGRNSGSNSPASENQLADRKVSSPSPQNLGSYADIGLVHDDTASYAPSESQHQQQDPPELPTFSAYDPQSGYDIRYFRPIIDETVRAQGVLSPQEDLSSHMVNSMPASTIAMVQQQQQQVAQVAQMYPQVHFANIMPYRQYMSPVYVPSPGMAMAAGYSSNPAAAGAYSHHPSNASSGYVLMPSPGAGGGTSPHPHHHLAAKYGIQQFKPLPTGSPTGFATNFTGGGYGVVGGIEDSSRIKYKDGNLYIGGQAETSEIWMNPRDLPSLQSAAAAAAAASYYNMAGQVPPPHAAATATYLPSHTAHHAAASFNAVAQQSSHMQFPGGLYHSPQQAAAIASPHHMGGNVAAAAAAPGAQLGAYQQPQLGHLSWTGNF